MGAIDIVVNLFTEQEVRLGQTGLDDTFKSQIRMAPDIRGGVSIDDYLQKMNRFVLVVGRYHQLRLFLLVVQGCIPLLPSMGRQRRRPSTTVCRCWVFR